MYKRPSSNPGLWICLSFPSSPAAGGSDCLPQDLALFRLAFGSINPFFQKSFHPWTFVLTHPSHYYNKINLDKLKIKDFDYLESAENGDCRVYLGPEHWREWIYIQREVTQSCLLEAKAAGATNWQEHLSGHFDEYLQTEILIAIVRGIPPFNVLPCKSHRVLWVKIWDSPSWLRWGVGRKINHCEIHSVFATAKT